MFSSFKRKLDFADSKKPVDFNFIYAIVAENDFDRQKCLYITLAKRMLIPISTISEYGEP